LGWIVLGKISDQNIGIETNHLAAAPRAAIAAFISSRETGLVAGMIPFRLLIDFVAAITVNWPFSASINSIRSPVPIPSAVREVSSESEER
jgi:hypothetical protein